MDRGKQLDKNEIKQILLLRSQNQTITKIAKILNKSYHVVYNFLKNSKIYRKKILVDLMLQNRTRQIDHMRNFQL